MHNIVAFKFQKRARLKAIKINAMPMEIIFPWLTEGPEGAGELAITALEVVTEELLKTVVTEVEEDGVVVEEEDGVVVEDDPPD
jgi:hypothetical protein